MSPAEGERRLISEMTASVPSARRRALAKDVGRGWEASARASSDSETSRRSGAISRRFQAMISVSLSDILSRKGGDHETHEIHENEDRVGGAAGGVTGATEGRGRRNE